MGKIEYLLVFSQVILSNPQPEATIYVHYACILKVKEEGLSAATDLNFTQEVKNFIVLLAKRVLSLV
jgi:hypothetical protein